MSELKKRRTEITIETHSLTIIKLRGVATNPVYCPACGQDALIFTVLHAALIFRVRKDFLETITRSNQIHLIAEDAVCGNSLSDYFKQKISFDEE